MFMVYIITYLLNTPINLTFNPPKAHVFVKKALNSATNNIVMGIAVSPFISSVVIRSAYLFAVSMHLDVFYNAISFISIPLLINIMQRIIQNTSELHMQALAYLNDQTNSLAMLREAHEYLTPYIRSYEELFWFIIRIVRYLIDTDSDYSSELEELEELFRVTGNRLLAVYRDIEREISINIGESPIAPQWAEDY